MGLIPLQMSTILVVYIPKPLPKMRRILMIIMALLDVAHAGQSVSGIYLCQLPGVLYFLRSLIVIPISLRRSMVYKYKNHFMMASE